MIYVLRRLAAIAALFALAACATNDLGEAPKDFGNFQLGHNIVVAKNAKPVGPSRQATPEEWESVLKGEIAKRFGRYKGDKLYHIGIGVDGYALAVPGIPVLLSPKSALVISVNIWDDTAQRKVNAEPKRFTVFEQLSGETVVGSGLTQSREQQMENLARNAARLINNWLVENKAWFSPEAVAARASAGAQTLTAEQVKTAAAATPVPVPAPAPAPAN